MKIRKNALLVFATIVLISSCKKDDDAPKKEPLSGVFVGGEVEDDTTANYIATLWKNGTRVSYTSPVISDAEVNDMTIFGDDIYATGYYYDISGASQSGPCYWKNGSLVLLNGGASSIDATGIAVSDGNVYVIGVEYDVTPVSYIWRNGIKSTLLGPNGEQCFAKDIYVSGTDVYVVGSTYSNNGGQSEPVLWINGTASTLSGGTSATGVCKVGSDLYVSGAGGYTATGYEAVYWKNGVKYVLSTLGYPTGATSVYHSNGDLYFSGVVTSSSTPHEKVVYWKNGVINYVTNGQETAYAKGVVVQGEDVYVYGTETSAKTSRIWKNGISIVPDGTAGTNYSYSVVCLK